MDDRARARQRARRIAMAEWNRVKGSPRAAAFYYYETGLIPIPLCWPAADGKCGCGKHSSFRAGGLLPLLPTNFPPGIVSRNSVATWFTKWPQANVGILLNRSGTVAAITSSAKGAKNAGLYFHHGPWAFASSHSLAYLFAAPPALVLAESWRWDRLDVEIRTNRFVIVPPSRRSFGGRWRWAVPPGVGLPELPLAPESTITPRMLRPYRQARLHAR
jgi:hypothetical protein